MPDVEPPSALGRMQADDLILLLMLHRGYANAMTGEFPYGAAKRSADLGLVRFFREREVVLTEGGQVVLNAVLALIGDKA